MSGPADKKGPVPIFAPAKMGLSPSQSWIVVTDLDGTLLDAETYSWEPARETLAELAARGIPVVFCTSKTRAECEVLQAAMNLRDPLIVESGGAVCIGDETIALGTPYAELCARFRALQELTGGALCGFSEMSDAQLAAESGMTLAQAALARRRQYDEAFSFVRDEAVWLPAVAAQVARWGLRLSRGGRYWHLHGENDKGVALRRLLERYPHYRTIGLGDSALDLPMLEAVSLPVVVARPDGSHDPDLVAGLPRLAKMSEPGPAGWRRAIEEFVFQMP